MTMVNPTVVQALKRIEAAKLGVGPDVADCLDQVAELVKSSGDPDAVFDSLLDRITREDLGALAKGHGLRLYESTQASVDDGTVTEVVVFWRPNGTGFAVVPYGQRPRDTLAQLRTAIEEREEDRRLAVDFQASVAAGHVEDVAAWMSRVSAKEAS